MAEFGFVVPSRTIDVVKLKQILSSDKSHLPEPARTVLRSVYQHIDAINEHISGIGGVPPISPDSSAIETML
ncbi:hypothetical protein J2X43_002907 [Rhizobium sp. BE258]|nr:hypothetical protein [Rhizobium sp. BE258]